MDDFIVTDEERLQAVSPIGFRFKGLSHYMKILVPKFTENLPADQHLFNLEVDLYRLRRLFERNSPSIRIQSFYRGYRVRSQSYFSAGERMKAATKIQKVYRGWIHRRKTKRQLIQMLKEEGLEELMLSQPEYRLFKAGCVIAKAAGRFAKQIRREKLL